METTLYGEGGLNQKKEAGNTPFMLEMVALASGDEGKT